MPPSREHRQLTETICFSLVTLASPVFADIPATANLTRSGAVIETIAGPFHVAVDVAALVSSRVWQTLLQQTTKRGI